MSQGLVVQLRAGSNFVHAALTCILLLLSLQVHQYGAVHACVVRSPCFSSARRGARMEVRRVGR